MTMASSRVQLYISDLFAGIVGFLPTFWFVLLPNYLEVHVNNWGALAFISFLMQSLGIWVGFATAKRSAEEKADKRLTRACGIIIGGLLAFATELVGICVFEFFTY